MKHIIRIFVLAIALVTGLKSVSAQTVQVLMSQRIPALPVTVTSYLDDPLRYFNVQFILTGAGSAGLDIYFDMDFTLAGSTFYVRTRPGSLPLVPIHLNEGPNMMRSDVLQTQVVHRAETNVNYSNPLDYQQLPEGKYHLCVTVYRWDSRGLTSEPIGDGCFDFDICYSGSAPELVSPMAGAQISSNGAMIVTPSRKVNFFWVPVISNCAGRNTRFRYQFKMVKVLNGQNYNDAIKYNPTVFSAEVRNSNYVVLDTLRDIKVQLEVGALYVAQVHAETISNRNDDIFIIANNGNSQPMAFFWGYNQQIVPGTGIYNPIYPNENLDGATVDASVRSSRRYGYVVEDESEEGEQSEGIEGMTLWTGGVETVSGLETIVEEMKEPYFAEFIRDAATVTNLVTAYPEEWKYVPNPKHRYVESDGYYTVPMTDDLEVRFMPLRHDAVKDVSYIVELYDYVDGGVDSITAYMPLFSDTIGVVDDHYSKMDSHELIKRSLAGWGAGLEQSNLYYLQLSTSFKADYWDYEIADTSFYVNEMLAEHVHDTVSREFVEQELAYANGVFFQWGDDPAVPGHRAPQWKAPVDRTGVDLYDPMNVVVPVTIPEVKKAKTFPVSWEAFTEAAENDVVQYEVNVYELKPNQSLEEAIASNTAVVSRTVTDATEIPETDTKFFKAFAPGKTYVITLTTDIYSEEYSYHFENGNAAIPIVIKIVK